RVHVLPACGSQREFAGNRERGKQRSPRHLRLWAAAAAVARAVEQASKLRLTPRVPGPRLIPHGREPKFPLHGGGGMENIAVLLSGLGTLGIAGGLILGVVALVVLPWWAIFDCIFSHRSGGLKVVGVLLLLITWGFGSLVYGLFITTTRALRLVTA